MRYTIYGAGLVLAITLLGCANVVAREPRAGEPAPTTAAPAEQVITFDAKVVYLDFEGGFWGLATDDGKHYDPLGLPKEFQHVGMRVHVRAQVRTGIVHFHGWGTLIKLLDIQPVDAP